MCTKLLKWQKEAICLRQTASAGLRLVRMLRVRMGRVTWCCLSQPQAWAEAQTQTSPRPGASSCGHSENC
jgi:hypothetical protein